MTPHHASEVRLDTTEVRWFASGRLPDLLVGWFIGTGHATLEVRNDSYLVDGSHDVGRKKRDHGVFEVKRRQRAYGLLRLGEDLEGRIEDWQKVAGVRPPIEPAECWHSVGKVVLTRTYQPDERLGMIEVRRRDMTTPGCDVELAAVSLDDIQAWTFALEAWGPVGDRRQMLADTAHHFVEEAGLPHELTSRLTDDMGYPEWLASVVAVSPDRDVLGFTTRTTQRASP